MEALGQVLDHLDSVFVDELVAVELLLLPEDVHPDGGGRHDVAQRHDPVSQHANQLQRLRRTLIFSQKTFISKILLILNKTYPTDIKTIVKLRNLQNLT